MHGMGSPGGSRRAYKSSRSLVWRAMARWQGLEGFSATCRYQPFTTAHASFSLPSAQSRVAFSPARRARSTRSSPDNRLIRLVSLRPSLGFTWFSVRFSVNGRRAGDSRVGDIAAKGMASRQEASRRMTARRPAARRRAARSPVLARLALFLLPVEDDGAATPCSLLPAARRTRPTRNSRRRGHRAVVARLSQHLAPGPTRVGSGRRRAARASVQYRECTSTTPAL